ncbi:MAG TPA: pyridine nucleotide-disulfide oxidoreductase, partial [Nitrosomonas sp.]|nr:pyridine nucleotide-disulfide oxidoreductase [Nitrosomonas sp.]
MTYSQSTSTQFSSTVMAPELKFGVSFLELYRRDGLLKLDQAFLEFLGSADPVLRARLDQARLSPNEIAPKDESILLIDLAPWAEDFIGQLFGIEKEVRALAAKHHELAPLYFCKRQFVQRRAKTKVSDEILSTIDGIALEKALEVEFGEPFSELVFATHVANWLDDEANNAARIEKALHYAAWALRTPEGQMHTQAGILFKTPAKLDFLHLLSLSTDNEKGFPLHRLDHLRHREGFSLTDTGTDLVGALDEANYCIWCHEQGKDSCSKGFIQKPKSSEELPSFKKSELGVLLAGCPLEERISEFHKLKTQGHAIGSLAMIVLDNPMCAGTGHRICNDCMKSCIYQKQVPVNIPQAETRTLKDVLELPWGFEIYSLLTRWNPLDLRRPLPKPATGKKVLVVGMGPAGYTLAH